MGTGSVCAEVELDASLFYRILGETTGLDIHGESDLLPILLELSRIQKEYAKIEPALREVEATGYGIVMPEQEEMTLEEPEIIKQGGRWEKWRKLWENSRIIIIIEIVPWAGLRLGIRI